MPRINAPTLAEHRESRLAALLDAGSSLLAEGGEGAVTMSAVAQEAGLSRPAVYEYFTSTEDLLAAVISKEADAWSIELSASIDAAETPEAKIRAYVEAAARKQRTPGVLEAVSEPLLPTLHSIGVRDVEVAISLLHACTRVGPDVDATCSFILGGLRELQ